MYIAILSMEVRSISPSLPLLPELIVKIWPSRSLQAPTSDALQGTIPEGVLLHPPQPHPPCLPFPPRPARPALLAQAFSSGISWILFSWDLFGSSSLFVLPDELTQTYSFMNVLKECNPIVLVLILMQVLVGRLPPELVVVKIDFTSFLTIYLSFTKL